MNSNRKNAPLPNRSASDDVRVEEALQGLVAPMDLSTEEQERYFDRLGESYAKPSPTEDTFFSKMNSNVVEDALQGLISIDDLNGDEQEAYLERLDELHSTPSRQMDDFFKGRQARGEGVGLDENNNLIYADSKPTSKPTSKQD